MRLHHAPEGVVLPVLDLDPVLLPAAAIGSIAMSSLEAHAARGAALERVDENALWPPMKESLQKEQRKCADLSPLPARRRL